MHREMESPRGEASERCNLAGVLQAQGKDGEALAHLERALDIICELGDALNEAAVRGNLALALRALGRPAEALAEQERSLSIARKVGYRNGEAIALLNIGSIWHEWGQMPRAREAMESALAICREIGARRPEGYVLLGLAHVALAEGDPAAAMRLTRESLDLRRDTHHAEGISQSLALLGELLVREGDLEGARKALEEALEHVRHLNVEGQEADILVRLARFAGGDVQAALTAFEDAGEAGDTLEIRFGLWEVTQDKRHLEAAKRLLDGQVEQVPPEYGASMLENMPVHRELMDAWASRDSERAEGVEGEYGGEA